MARPRKPTNLKVLQGTAQKCRLNTAEPRFTGDLSAPPDYLSERAKAFWINTASLLSSQGVVSAADVVSFECMAETYSEMVAARLKIRDLGGPTYETTNKMGDVMYRAHPEVGIVSDCDRRLCAWFARFGMTPADRSRVSATVKQESNPWEALATAKKA